MSIEIIFKEENDQNDLPTAIEFDLSDCCRTCLQPECCLTPTNSSDSDSIKFCDKLAACVSETMWPKEGEPFFICGMCIEKLRIAYDFRTLCLESDQAVRLQAEANEIGRYKSATLDITTTTVSLGCDKITCEETQLQPLSQFAPDTSAAAQLEVTQTLDNRCEDGCEVCGKKLCEHIDFRAVPLESNQVVRLQAEANEIQSCRNANSDHTTTTALSVCDKTIAKSLEMQKQLLPQCLPLASAAVKLEVTQTLDNSPKLGCHICGKELCEHIENHTGENYLQCSICYKQFPTTAKLIVHRRTHIGKKPYACNFCEKKYVNESDYLVHLSSHTGEKQFACSYCGKKFTRSSSLNLHMKIHTDDRHWQCHICNKVCANYSHLLNHTMTHTREKFSCKLCRKEFKFASQLSVHMREHTGKQPYKCTFCDKVCDHSAQLQAHMIKHTGEKLSCSKCDKKFYSSRTLNIHLKIHTGENLFKCSDCDCVFPIASELKKHAKRHTDEKPFVCEICDGKFARRGALTVHKKKHAGENYSCKLCDKKFTWASALNVHMRKHTGEKYSCKLCDKKFSYALGLNVHTRTHTGEKYSCKLCDKTFAWASTLKIHMKTHTSEKP